MKIRYTTKNHRMQVELDANSVREVFKQVAEFQEIFEEQHCGMCKSDDIRFVVRTVDGNDFYERKCFGCGAKLAYGQHKNGGGLFPKRKKEDGSFDREHFGWHKWTPDASA